jgi:hypothetical protein
MYSQHSLPYEAIWMMHKTPGLNRYSTFHQEVKAGAKSHKPLSKRKKIEKKEKKRKKLS